LRQRVAGVRDAYVRCREYMDRAIDRGPRTTADIVSCGPAEVRLR
jgi:hypothetical protein